MGVKMTIWKQGQFYPELGTKVVDLPSIVLPGPSDEMLVLDGFHVVPDRNGNFVQGGEVDYSEDELDAIHTFAIVRLLIQVFEKELGHPIRWHWWKNKAGAPLTVKIRNYDINTRYIRSSRCIELDFYGSESHRVYTCRSVDLICHEVGHAVLDGLKPAWSNSDPETEGLMEAFCDLSAMYFVLSQEDLCAHVFKETGGDLSKNSILSLFGVGYGYEGNPYKEIRSAVNKSKYISGHWNPYVYCNVVVGLLYDLIQILFNDCRNNLTNDAEVLYRVGSRWMKVIIQCFLKCSDERSGVSEFCQYLSNEFNHDWIKKLMEERDIPC